MNQKNRNMIKVLLIALAFVTAGVVYSCAAGGKSAQPETDLQDEAFLEEASSESKTETGSKSASEQESKTESEPEEAQETVCVHVCGSVREPGVYYLHKGARVHEAVEMAGGLLKEADSAYVNLAKEAEDGSQIYIPSRREVEEEKVPQGLSEGKEAEMEAADSRVNLNTASLDELRKLPGIGEVKAKAILAYREKHGNFSSIEDITKVAGIKSGSYERIRDLIKV